MRSNFFPLLFISISLFSFSQNEFLDSVNLTSSPTTNQELRDILGFEEIEYIKLSFDGKALKGKTYTLSVKEIWDGEIKDERVLFDSKNGPPIANIQTIQDSTFNLRIISKHQDGKLKLLFKFPKVDSNTDFESVQDANYSLRVIEPKSHKVPIGERLYLLAYIQPYQKDGINYYCDVENSGEDIENWGKRFDIKHYLVFEMVFE